MTEENFAAMGFKSLEEAAEARLGEPLPLFYVRLDQLQEYQPGSDPEGLLVNSERVIFPVTAKEEVRSSIVVEGAEDGWRAVDFGAPNLIGALSDVRQESGREGSDFAVWIPSLNLYFLGTRSDPGLSLTPILDDPRFEFVAGGTLSAYDVFTRLLPAARDSNGLPSS
jgi:hypothetical protein